MSTAAQKHVVAFTVQAWGHQRPLLNLTARLVKLRPNVVITFLTTNALYDRSSIELSRSFVPGEEDAAAKVRLVSIGGGQGLQVETDNEHFIENWKKLAAQKELVCAKTGVSFGAPPPPSAAIIDLFAIEPIRAVRRFSAPSVKVYAWMGGSTYGIFYLFGPENMGGRGNLHVKAEQEAQKTGRPYDDIVWELASTPKGEVVQIPAFPPMYDYEYYPQDFPMPEEFTRTVFPHVYETLEAVDGIFLYTPEPFEPGAVDAVRKWYGETGRPTFVTGPLLPPPSATASENEKKQSKVATEIEEFLEVTLKTSGEKSLLYISFGSIFWPVKTPEKLWAFVDVIIEKDIPFILSHGSPFATVPDEIKEKVKKYGKGLLSPWSPQQMILGHPVTGWFLAHGGHNGVTEAISAGVPFIVWPFGGDQPLNAVHIAEQLKIGYELVEVRTGYGTRARRRDGRKPVGTIEALKAEARDVLAKAFGPDGAEKRKRLEVLTQAVANEWKEGGSALRDVSTFLDSL
ncbi:UDP-Glycosyltransferase/glycogen phosphorylase [Trametes meyenii]|nr:UDP-Glycosyltransferase/glycogen phosphorylase [Trametes meyenii]